MDESEIAAVQGQLNGIFGLIEAMRAVDTTGVAPMSHPQDVSLRLRDDVVSESDRRAAAYQAVAPAWKTAFTWCPR